MRLATYTHAYLTLTCAYFTLEVKQVSLVLGRRVFEHGAEDVQHAAAAAASLGGGGVLS